MAEGLGSGPSHRKSVNDVPCYGNTEVILEPYSYLLQIPGKGMRTRLISAFNHWFKIEWGVAKQIGAVVQRLHTASLLIDDIEDNSVLRRGIPVAHSVYGTPWTINCANYVYFQAMDMCTKLGNPQAVRVFLDEMLQLHMGQGFDIYWRDCNTCPTEEEYIAMVIDKTGGLFRLAVKLMGCFSDVDMEQYVPLVNQLGLYFQVRDDYINLANEKYMVNKTFCEDLSEGKFSFPIIHCINAAPSDRRMLNILKQRTESVEVKQYAVDFMRECGSFDYTLHRMKEIHRGIMQQIQDLGGNEELERIMRDLANFDYHGGSASKHSPASASSSGSPADSLSPSSSSGAVGPSPKPSRRPALTLSSEGNVYKAEDESSDDE